LIFFCKDTKFPLLTPLQKKIITNFAALEKTLMSYIRKYVPNKCKQIWGYPLFFRVLQSVDARAYNQKLFVNAAPIVWFIHVLFSGLGLGLSRTFHPGAGNQFCLS